MRAKVYCRCCGWPGTAFCPTCKRIVDEQRAAREQQEAAKKIVVDRDFLLAVENLLAGLVRQRVVKPAGGDACP